MILNEINDVCSFSEYFTRKGRNTDLSPSAWEALFDHFSEMFNEGVHIIDPSWLYGCMEYSSEAEFVDSELSYEKESIMNLFDLDEDEAVKAAMEEARNHYEIIRFGDGALVTIKH